MIRSVPVTTVFESPDELPGAVGTHLGYSDWVTIDQERVNLFADATGDHQWIHLDAERAAAGPFGTTIAHGYLTLSLTVMFMPELLQVKGISMGINYGTNKVRFPAPLLVGSRVRAGAEILEVTEVTGGYQTVMKIAIEVEGSDRPVCVVESVSRFMR
ncbi:MAG: dehydratase [Actinobacteria bacterium]|jgi:acyl dehydratase|nr:dehydratase [Actinomycetota bacterium]|tara:strand:+ start:11774 stop:12247 length:474 start_codon:yes stop_codon:yes gene_type:complete